MAKDMISLDDLQSLAIGSARGKRAMPLSMEFERELGPSDLPLILEPPPQGAFTPPLARIRNSHHMLARLLAEGKSGQEASLVTGYAPSRISILQNDPAFSELVTYYKGQVEAKYLDVHERLASLGLSSLDELQARLEEDPNSFKNRELMELAEFALDRSVTKDARKAGANAGAGAPIVQVTFVGSASSPPEGGSGGVNLTPGPSVIDLDFLDLPGLPREAGGGNSGNSSGGGSGG